MKPFVAEKLKDYKGMAKDILAGKTDKQDKQEDQHLQKLVSDINCRYPTKRPPREKKQVRKETEVSNFLACEENLESVFNDT
jgi:hypothetical protein